MPRERTAPRGPTKGVLEAISNGLGEIGAHVGFAGVSTAKSDEQVEGTFDTDSAEEELGEDDRGDDDYSADYFDREEIEVALDAFLSALLSAKVISKNKAGKLPSFSDVFIKFFGPDHEIVAKARNFEEYVQGYFGWISPEDMTAAQEEFSEIQESVRETLEGLDAQ